MSMFKALILQAQHNLSDLRMELIAYAAKVGSLPSMSIPSWLDHYGTGL